MIRVAAAGLLTAVLLNPLPAEAAARPWKARLKVPGPVLFSGLAAASAKSAWAVGSRLDSNRQASYFFDGRKWRPAPLPKGAAVGSVPGMPPTLAASPAGGAWALSPGDADFDQVPPGDPTNYPCATARAVAARRDAMRAGITITKPSRLLRWKKGRWTYAKTFKNVAVHAVAVRGKEVFAFGLSKDEKGLALRFDGRRWRTSRLPLYAWNASTAGGDLWVQGFGEKDGRMRVLRFNGGKWSDVGLDRVLPADIEATKDKPGLYHMVTAISGSGRGRVSVSGFALREKLCPGNEGEFGKAEPFLFHFAGGTWRKDPLKGMKGLQIDTQVSDGRGGLYATVGQAFGFDGETQTIMHGTSGGVWTREKLPSGLKVFSLGAIPGGGFWAGASNGRSSFLLRK